MKRPCSVRQSSPTSSKGTCWRKSINGSFCDLVSPVSPRNATEYLTARACLYRCFAWLKSYRLVLKGNCTEVGVRSSTRTTNFFAGTMSPILTDARRSPSGDRRSECHQEVPWLASDAETDQQLCEVVGDPDERCAQGEWAAEFGHGEHGIGRNEAEGSNGRELVAEVGQQGRRGHRRQDQCVNDYGHQQRPERVLNRREYKAERCEDGDHAELAKRVMARPVARQELREHHDVDEVPEEEGGKASEKELVGAKDAEARYSEQEVSGGAEGERNAEKIANAKAQHSEKGDAGDLGDRGPVGGGVKTRAEEDQRGGGREEKDWASFHPMSSVLRAEPRRNSIVGSIRVHDRS